MALRVLHVAAGYPTAEQPHNQMFIKTQVDSLVRAGVDCEVLALKGRGARKYLAGWPQVRKAARDRRFDLIHAHYAYCAAVCFGHGLPVVTSLLGSDLVGHTQSDGSYTAFSQASHRWLARLIASRSAACIVKSDQMRRVLGREVSVVPNGVDFDQFRPLPAGERAEARRSLGLDAGTRYVLFAGNPDWPRKRFPLAREAVRIAAAAVPFPLELRPLSGRSHADVVRHMQACDLLLLTSSWEGSPNVLKEALAADLAVVSVDVGDARERLTGVSGCRLAEPDSPAAVGAAVAELLLSTEPRAGRQAVASLRIEKVAERVVAIYQEALEARRR